MSSGGTNALHKICPIEVSISSSGTRAISESSGSITARFSQNNMQYDCTSLCRFISRFERVEGQWKLLTLEAIYVRDLIAPAFPGKGESGLVVEGLEERRESYRYLGWLLAQKGFEIRGDLPGVDDEGSIGRAMEEK
jgi:hypothetical protein